MHPEEAVLFFLKEEDLREGSHTELNSVCGCVGGYSTERELKRGHQKLLGPRKRQSSSSNKRVH